MFRPIYDANLYRRRDLPPKKFPKKKNSKEKLKRNLKRTLSCLHRNASDYFHESTLHGLKYVGNRKISWFERITFLVCVSIVFILASYFISDVWSKRKNSPMIISLNASTTTIQDIPFPAVTICNMNRIQKSALEQLPPDEFALAHQLCIGSLDDDHFISHSSKWEQFKDVLLKVTQPCEEMLISCNYAGESFTCTDIFHTILTDEGLCCVFNGVHRKFLMKTFLGDLNVDSEPLSPPNYWTPEHGFKSDELMKDSYSSPRPAGDIGMKFGLILILNTSINEYYCGSTLSYGFRIVLHSPNEIATVSSNGISIPNGYESDLIIRPTISQATEAVKSIPRKIRQCIFEEENFLAFFHSYSAKNCEFECFANLTLFFCKCVPFYMPRLNNKTKICGHDNAYCTTSLGTLKQLQLENLTCPCLPGCHEIDFDASVTSIPLQRKSQGLVDYDASDAAIARVFYVENEFRSQRRSEVFGFTDLLSNIGGLMSLFVGFSVLSIIELIYFMTLRPFCYSLRRSRQRNKQRDNNLKKPTISIVNRFKPKPKIASTQGNSYAVYPFTH